MWTIRRVVTWATEDLRGRGASSPRLEVELLLGLVLGLDRVQLIVDADRPLRRDELARYRALHQRRRAGEPVAYLRGVREFYGRNFRVDARVLVPWPETEILVEVALRRTRALSLSARVLDLCTGSGCVAITLARERPTIRIMGADISEHALVVARENASRLGATHQIVLLHSDLYAALAPGAKFDLITANPPYIPDPEIPSLPVDVRAFEPRLALAGGDDGLAIVRRIVAQAPSFLAPGGVLALEIGAEQAPQASVLLEQAGLTAIERERDYAGHERVVSGELSRRTEPSP